CGAPRRWRRLRRGGRGPCTPSRGRTRRTDPSSPRTSSSPGRRGACSFRLHDPDEGEVPVTLGPVEAVADHEAILDGEAEVVDGDLDLGARRFVEQGADLEARRVAGVEELEEVGDGEAGVDDVLDEQH